MDIRRTVLWVVFSFSLMLLIDAGLRHAGQPSMFGGVGVPATVPPTNTSTSSLSTPTALPADNAVPISKDQTLSTPVSAPPPTLISQRLSVRTDVLLVEVDTKGGEVRRVELLNHKDANDAKKNVVLLDNTPGERVYLARSGLIGGENVPNHNTVFEVVSYEPTLTDGQKSVELVLKAQAGGVELIKTYVFQRGHYEVQVRHDLTNYNAAPLNAKLYLQLVRDGNTPKGESMFYSTFTGPAVYSEVEKFQKIKFADIEKGQTKHVASTNNGWIAMVQHYFVSAWIPEGKNEREIQSRKVDTNLYAINTVLRLDALAPGASTTSQAALYVGPQYQKTLETLAPGLDLVVDYGWLTFVAKPLFWLLQWLYSLTHNWGWAIILLTVLVKAVFYPLSATSYKSMAKMRAVTPRMTKIREQHKNDRQQMNMAMMDLYKNEKINPLGGCLPIVVQIPVFIALYWTLLAAVEMRGAPWVGWIRDLTLPDPWYVLPVVMIVTMWVQFKLNPTPPDPIQAKVFAFMPLIFGATMIFFPAGLVLYWVVNNILSIAQQWQITRAIEGKPLFGTLFGRPER